MSRKGRKLKTNKAHGNSQYKVRQVLFAQRLCVRVIIHMWVAIGTIHCVKVC